MTSSFHDLTTSDFQISNPVQNERGIISDNINFIINIVENATSYTNAELEHAKLCCQALLTFSNQNNFKVSLFGKNSKIYNALRNSSHSDEEIERCKDYYFPTLRSFDVIELMQDFFAVLEFLINMRKGYFDFIDVTNLFHHYNIHDSKSLNSAVAKHIEANVSLGYYTKLKTALNLSDDFEVKNLIIKYKKFSKNNESKKLAMLKLLNESLIFKITFTFSHVGLEINSISSPRQAF
nr:p28 [Strawberry pallidosis-associated virus]